MNQQREIRKQQKLFQDVASLLDKYRYPIPPHLTGEFIHFYWKLGQRIVKDMENRLAEDRMKVIRVLAEQLKATYSKAFSNKALWSMVEFAREYPQKIKLHSNTFAN